MRGTDGARSRWVCRRATSFVSVLERHIKASQWDAPLAVLLAAFSLPVPQANRILLFAGWSSPSIHRLDQLYCECGNHCSGTIEENIMPNSVEFVIEQGDVTAFDADVLALKYA